MSTDNEHGPEMACYANDGIAHQPLIICLCGWSSGVGKNMNWEECGAAFDEHLAEFEE